MNGALFSYYPPIQAANWYASKEFWSGDKIQGADYYFKEDRANNRNPFLIS
jgi:hypothetical protein